MSIFLDMKAAKNTEPGVARREEGHMASTSFAVGDRVENFPFGFGRTDVVVEGVVAGVFAEDPSSVEVAANFRGEYVRFVADVSKTRRAS